MQFQRIAIIVSGLFLLISGACIGPTQILDMHDETPPKIVSVHPEDGASNQALNTHITVVFDEELDPASIESNSVVLAEKSTSNTVAVEVALASYSSNTVLSNTLVAKPGGFLQADCEYSVYVNPGICN